MQKAGWELKGACLLFSWKTKAKERHQAKERTMLAESSKSSPQAFIQLVASFDISEDFDVRKDCRAVSSLMSSVVGLDVLGHLFQPWRFCFYMYDHLEEISHFGCLFSQNFHNQNGWFPASLIIHLNFTNHSESYDFNFIFLHLYPYVFWNSSGTCS